MNKATLTIEQLLRSFPDDRESLQPYIERARVYSRECGCSLAAVFLAGSLGLLIV